MSGDELKWRVPLADVDFGAEEEAAVLEVLRSRWLTMGAMTQRFEEEFARFLGVEYAVAVSNATQALHLACLALGIGAGDEVIAPSLTFVATVNAILYTGAEVRFADIISVNEPTISPEGIEQAVTRRTKAIIVMHYGGYACRMPEIMKIAEKHGLFVIEDAAHAPGASLQGKHLGSWGDAGCFSFFSNKNLTTGEGGMLVTRWKEVAEKARLLRSHGMTSLTWDRHRGHAHSYDVLELGYNYRIDEIRAALGLVQLKKLEDNNARRKLVTEGYRNGLANLGVGLPFSGHPGIPAYHLFPILLPDREGRSRFIERMRAERIQTSIHYPPIHLFRYYRERFPGLSLPVSEQFACREVTLPLYPGMDDQAVKVVLRAVQMSLASEQQLGAGKEDCIR